MYEIEQTHQRYYGELKHQWNEATQIIDGDTGKVLKRNFSFLEFDADWRATLINSPPNPQPYYDSGETPANAYFSVRRTAFNTLYEGGEELELKGEGVDSASKFKQWAQIRIKFDYERFYLDQEIQFILWQPKPPPDPIIDPVTGGTTFRDPDPRYDLFIGDNLIRERDEDEIVMAIPGGIFGISCNTSGVYLVDSEDDEREDFPVTSQTQLINKPYLRFTKSSNSDTSFRVSLRGKTSRYLPGTFIPRDYSEPKIIDFPRRLPRSQRLVPPGITLDFSFPEIDRDDHEDIQKRSALDWGLTLPAV